jgi:hypothetical protein
MNTINEEEFNKRLVELMESLKIILPSGKTIFNKKVNKEQINEMFILYNDRNQKKEFGKSCSICVGRVFNALHKLYIKNNYE